MRLRRERMAAEELRQHRVLVAGLAGCTSSCTTPAGRSACRWRSSAATGACSGAPPAARRPPAAAAAARGAAPRESRSRPAGGQRPLRRRRRGRRASSSKISCSRMWQRPRVRLRPRRALHRRRASARHSVAMSSAVRVSVAQTSSAVAEFRVVARQVEAADDAARRERLEHAAPPAGRAAAPPRGSAGRRTPARTPWTARQRVDQLGGARHAGRAPPAPGPAAPSSDR